MSNTQFLNSKSTNRKQQEPQSSNSTPKRKVTDLKIEPEEVKESWLAPTGASTQDDSATLQEYIKSGRAEQVDIFDFKFACPKAIESLKKDLAIIDQQNMNFVDMMLFRLDLLQQKKIMTPLYQLSRKLIESGFFKADAENEKNQKINNTRLANMDAKTKKCNTQKHKFEKLAQTDQFSEFFNKDNFELGAKLKQYQQERDSLKALTFSEFAQIFIYWKKKQIDPVVATTAAAAVTVPFQNEQKPKQIPKQNMVIVKKIDSTQDHNKSVSNQSDNIFKSLTQSKSFRDEKTPDLPGLHLNENFDTDCTFDEDNYFRRLLPKVNSATPNQISLTMYSLLECELKASQSSAKKKTIETVFKYSRRITEIRIKDVELNEEVKEDQVGMKRRRAVYQKNFDKSEQSKIKTLRNYADNPSELLIQLVQYKSNSEILVEYLKTENLREEFLLSVPELLRLIYETKNLLTIWIPFNKQRDYLQTIVCILQLSYLVEMHYGTTNSTIAEDYRELIDSAYSALESHVQLLQHYGVLGYRKYLIEKIKNQQNLRKQISLDASQAKKKNILF